MLTIPEELDRFNQSVNGTIDRMKTTMTDLDNKITELSTACTSAQDGFSSNYNSKNKNTIITKFNNISELLKTVGTSITETMNPMLTKSQELLDLIVEMDKYSKDEASQQSTLSTELNKAEEDRDARKISYARSAISEDTNKFNEKKTTAESLLQALKSMDSNLEFVNTFTSSDYLAYLDTLQYGTFVREKYTSPTNGVSVEYYIYKPDYGNANVEKVPVHVYLHGSGENGSGVLSCGLPKMIADKTITPEGIVICPQAVKGNEFYNAGYQQALIELIDSVVENDNGDPDRVSMSGHSQGAITGYRIVSKNPGYFSAFIPISGYCDTDIEGLTETDIWAFHGENDSRIPISDANSAVSKITKAGGTARVEKLVGQGHPYVQDYTFSHEFVDEEGNTISPLQWAMRKTRKNKEETTKSA